MITRGLRQCADMRVNQRGADAANFASIFVWKKLQNLLWQMAKNDLQQRC